MVKKTDKRKRDIKSKLIAAICMLLVSSIMMVSSTYAWFTLSTAPEVKGITTAVGANGNLEMALLPVSGSTEDIKTSVGDTLKAWTEKNITWGNLVNLSEGYGMDKIVLSPSALNLGADGKLPTNGTVLKTPTYGFDGRIDTLLANTVTSLYNSTSQNFPQTSGFGVRAVGVASGMTDRQLAYRNTLTAANTAMSLAKTSASQSLNTNGASLANIALAHGVDSTATHSHADVASLQAIINDLLGIKYETATGSEATHYAITTTATETVNGEQKTVTYTSYHEVTDTTTQTATHKVVETGTGSINYVETAYLNYIIAFGASSLGVTAGMDDDTFQTFQTAMTGADDVYAAADLCASYSITLPSEITTPLEALEETRENVEGANSDLSAITATEDIPWASTTTDGTITTMGISTPLYKLADTDAMQINSYAANTVKDNMSAIINSVASQGLSVTIATGGGVYADIADHCGDFDASIVIKKVEYNGLVLENMNARMKTATTVVPVYLTVLNTDVSDKAPASEGGQVMPITDMYGYIIDLAFKTNAANSDLLLQVEGADRIYSDNTNTETMGAGSTMTFKATTNDFSDDQVKSLMGCIRIIFFAPDTGEIYAYAKLDVENATSGADGITAEMYLYTMEASTTTTYTEATYAADSGLTYYTKSAEGEYTAIDDATASTSQEQLYTATTTSTAATETKSTDNVITDLTQNVAKAVSCLVYLDGETITNADVATAATSMTGTMNLQFASSATLKPMEYGDLHTPGATENVGG